MKKLLILCLMCLTATGCAGRVQHGYFAGASSQVDTQLADDSLKVLQSIYPPASSRFDLWEQPKDNFGAVLVEKMRAYGYAVFEPEIKNKTQEVVSPERASDTFSYVVDQVNTAPESSLYRVSLFIGNQSLSRVYSASSSGVVPAGAWARKE